MHVETEYPRDVDKTSAGHVPGRYHMREHFEVGIGLHQGSVFSPFLFTMLVYVAHSRSVHVAGPARFPISAILLPPSHKSKKMLPRKRDTSQSHTGGSLSGPALTIMSFNVEGLSAAKQQLVADLSSKHRCAVICMQETHRGPNDIRSNVPGIDLAIERTHAQYGSAI